MEQILDTSSIIFLQKKNIVPEEFHVLDKTLEECLGGHKDLIEYIERNREHFKKIVEYNPVNYLEELQYVSNKYSNLISMYNLKGYADIYLLSYLIKTYKSQSADLFSDSNNFKAYVSDKDLIKAIKIEFSTDNIANIELEN